MKRRSHKLWLALLMAPFIGLAAPAIYNRETPYFFGIPFFYWYQAAWVLVSTVILAAVYAKTRNDDPCD